MPDNKITLNKIHEVTESLENIHNVLDIMGREVYELQESKKLERSYRFERYDLPNFHPDLFSGNFEKGTPLFKLSYHWRKQQEFVIVVFPQSWFENPNWREIQEGITRKQLEKISKKEKLEYKKYLKLKEKFENHVKEKY